MENLVPLGTGNSRFMKSNISPSTTLAQLIQMLNSGTFPYDVGTINPAGISQQGTPLNKDTLLKDATAGLYGLGSDAVPDDVLNKLSKSILYEEAGSTTDVKGNPITIGTQIATGSYVGTGTYGASNPCSITADFPIKILMILGNQIENSRSYANGFSFNIPVMIGQNLSNEFDSSGITVNAERIPRDISYGRKSEDGKTFSWYNATSAYYQANDTGTTFDYLIIG